MTRTNMALNEIKIGEGMYREVYIYNDNPTLCIKILKKRITKQYFGKIKIHVNSRVFTLLRYGIRDFNVYENFFIVKLQQIIPNNIPKIFYINENNEVIESIIKDYNGDTSQSIQSSQKLESTNIQDFFNELEKLVNILIENDIILIDIGNVIVQEYEQGKLKPILYDFKRIGGRFNPFNITKGLKIKKIKRRFLKLKNKFI